ncbi:MAG TPA: YihY/virulence factor BrkB family protein [Roseiflexaceae bacterium]
MNTASAWDLLKETFSDYSQDKVPRLAAALAYYTAFAIAPLLVIAIAVAGFVFGREAASHQIAQTVSGVIGSTAGNAVNGMVQNAANNRGSGIVASIIGIITLLFAASGVFGELQDSLNTIWEVQPKPGQGIWGTIRQRFFSFAMVLVVGFLLLVSLVVSALLGAAGSFVAGDQFGQTLIWKVINFVVSFGVTTLLFALIFKYLPDVKIQWSDVWIGAAATALLFTIGKAALGWYLGRPGTTSTYGAAGSFVALLLWVYYTAQILFLGAEFTQVYAKRYGSKIRPAENAVPVTEEARAQQGIPRPAAVEQAAQLKERQLGGEDVVPEPAASATADQERATPQPKPAGAGAVTAFMLGLLLGRRGRSGRR